MRRYVHMNDVSPNWSDIVDWLSTQAHSKSSTDIVGRIVVVASTYYIWQERNIRIFRNQTRPPNILSDSIISVNRYKIMGLKLKKTPRVVAFLWDWICIVILYLMMVVDANRL